MLNLNYKIVNTELPSTGDFLSRIRFSILATSVDSNVDAHSRDTKETELFSSLGRQQESDKTVFACVVLNGTALMGDISETELLQMEEYKIIGRIGEGAHGRVIKAQDLQAKEVVALKRVLFKGLENAIPISILREIKILQLVKCKYVMELKKYFSQDNTVVLVFDFMPSGLWEMLHNFQTPPSISHIKAYMQMLLKGVSYLHDNSIMHRDLKPANLLISRRGILKIADLGLSRIMWNSSDNKRSYTHQVATRWYRAPELLYGSRHYNESIDLWAVGCIFAEMINKSPLFPGENDIEQLAMVLHKLGTPTEATWPGLHELPDYNKISFSDSCPVPFDVLIPDTDGLCIDLIRSFLYYDSSKRLAAKKALIHKYFFTPPMPCSEENLPLPSDSHREVVKKQADPDIDIYENMFENLYPFLSSP